MELIATRHELKLKQVFKLAHGSYPTRNTLIVSLTEQGITGYGESTEITYYGWDINDMYEKMMTLTPELSQLSLDDPRNFSDLLLKLLPSDPHLRSALDCALWDIYGKSKGAKTTEILNIDTSHIPLSSYTYTAQDISSLYDEIINHDWPIAKIKMGTPDDEELLRIISRDELKKPVRIDANQGWTYNFLDKHREVLQNLSGDKLEFVEQPVEKIHDKRLTEYADINFIADESCQNFQDIEYCNRYYNGINIKLMKCGGISEAIKMLDKAKSLGLKTMAGCMTESSIGISAMAQLAPLFDFIDLDGSALISNDPAEGVTVEKGILKYSTLNGNGAVMK